MLEEQVKQNMGKGETELHKLVHTSSLVHVIFHSMEEENCQKKSSHLHSFDHHKYKLDYFHSC